MSKTLEDALYKNSSLDIQSTIAEFRHAPWNYSVVAPTNLEDSPIITFHLSVGKVKKMYDVVLQWNLLTNEITSEEVSSPKIKTLKVG